MDNINPLLQQIIDFINVRVIRRCDDGMDASYLICDTPMLQTNIDKLIQHFDNVGHPEAVYYIAVIHVYYCLDVLEYYNTELYTVREIVKYLRIKKSEYNMLVIQLIVAEIITSDEDIYVSIRQDLLGLPPT